VSIGYKVFTASRQCASHLAIDYRHATIISGTQTSYHFAMRLIGKIRGRISPMRGILPARDYWKVINTVPLEESSVRLFGSEFHFSDGPGFVHSLEEIFHEEVYRFNSSSPTPFIVDAGANIGLSVVYFKRKYPDCQVVAFEPDRKIFGLLERNIRSMGYHGVDLHNSAAWIETTELTFYSEGSLAGSSEIDFSGAGNKYQVKAERLRDILHDRQVHFLKIDIEGAENTLLFDLGNILGKVDRIFIEYHSIPSKPQRLPDILHLLSSEGFRYSIRGNSDIMQFPFVDHRPAGFDLQLNIFCYRP
jgi:FkbM family methyltransferase